MLGFASHLVSVATTHLCHLGVKAAMEDTEVNGRG